MRKGDLLFIAAQLTQQRGWNSDLITKDATISSPSILLNSLALPTYWRRCREAKEEMRIKEKKVAYGPHAKQYALVVSDPAKTTPGKMAFYFHGGAWTFGRPETFVPAAIPWLAKGFTVVFPSYRRPPLVGLQGVVSDCWAAIDHFSPSGAVIDLHLGGMSAGAHLAALLATRPEKWRALGWPLAPQRILCCAGPLSFAEFNFKRLFLPHYQALDAIQQLASSNEESPQKWLLLHGKDDLTVSVSHSMKFYERLQELDYPAQLLLLENGTHLDSGQWMFGGQCANEVAQFIGA